MDEQRPTPPPIPPPTPPPAAPEADPAGRRRAYWLANVRAVTALLLVWGAVSFGCGILLADWLNHFRLPGSGFPLGFWFAQQGSIYVFVAIIFFYAWRMNKLDRQFDVHED